VLSPFLLLHPGESPEIQGGVKRMAAEKEREEAKRRKKENGNKPGMERHKNLMVKQEEKIFELEGQRKRE
jgi:hypothetical protein